MTESIWQHSHRRRTVSYDVAVVGGGIVGAATAYWLRQLDSSLRVAMLEAETPGAGASGRNAGFILLGTDTDYLSAEGRYGPRTAKRVWHFTRENRRMVQDLSGPEVGWEAQGSLTVAGDGEEDARLRQAVPRMRSAGIPVVYLDAPETNRRLNATGFQGSLYVTTGAVVNPLRLVHQLLAQSEADVFTYHPVQSLHRAGGGVDLVTPDVHVRADRVALTLNAYLPSLVPSTRRFVRPVRAQMLATEPADTRAVPLPAYSHQGYFYVRQMSDGQMLVGGGRHRHREAEVGYEDATTPAVQADIERYLHTHFPWTTGLGVQHRWSGTMGFSPDGRPVVGSVPDLPEAVFATGFTGHGMGYGVRMGRLLAEKTTGTDHPEGYDLFTAARFERARTDG